MRVHSSSCSLAQFAYKLRGVIILRSAFGLQYDEPIEGDTVQELLEEI